MNTPRLRSIIKLGLVSICLCFGSTARAQSILPENWPNRPIRLIVPSAAGGAGDITSRILAQKLAERLGQQVIVENRVGGNGTVGSSAIASAPPDGYTIGLITASTHAAAPASLPAPAPRSAPGPYPPAAFRPSARLNPFAFPPFHSKRSGEIPLAFRQLSNSSSDSSRSGRTWGSAS